MQKKNFIADWLHNFTIMVVFIFFCQFSFLNPSSFPDSGSDTNTTPSIGGYNVYYGSFHNHSELSDGIGTVEKAYSYAQNTAKLDFFSLTDHCYSLTLEKWMSMKNTADSFNQDNEFVALWGFEWSSSNAYGHVCVLHTEDYCSVNDSTTDSFTELVDWMSKRDGVAFFNHPGREDINGLEFCHFTTPMSDKFVGMELWNKLDGFNVYYYNDGYFSNDFMKSYFDEANSRGWKLGAAGGDDNHFGTWGTASDFRIAILAEKLSRTEILNSLKARRFYSTLDKNICLSFKINGKEMGSTLAPGVYVAQIQMFDENSENFTAVEMFDNTHTIINSWEGRAPLVELSYLINAAEGSYFYVKVTQADGDEAISSPIWISNNGFRHDFIGTWDSQGVYYRNSETAAWVKLASPATLITAGDLDGDGIDDLVGIWPGQGGVWVKYSATGIWAKLSSTARDIAAGDMNGDGRDDLLATWDGQGVYYRNSNGGGWVKMATPAEQVTAGDLDGDGKDDLVGIWPSQGGVWVKYSQSGSWAKLSSTAIDIASGDMNGDGRDDLLATWDGQGVYYRNSIGGAWVKLATPATLVTAGDLDGDGRGDVIGIWPSQGGVWVKYSQSGSWAKLSATARHIAAGLMRGSAGGSTTLLAEPFGGSAAEGPGSLGYQDMAATGPGDRLFPCLEEKNLTPQQDVESELLRVPGPGEYGFQCLEQKNLVPGSGIKRESKEKE